MITKDGRFNLGGVQQTDTPKDNGGSYAADGWNTLKDIQSLVDKCSSICHIANNIKKGGLL